VSLIKRKLYDNHNGTTPVATEP